MSSPFLSPNTGSDIGRYLNQRSFIFSSIEDKDYELTPEQLRVKNNILIILLCLAAYGIYYLIGSFIDFLIIGYVAGLAYHQTRTRFTLLVMSSKTYQRKSERLLIRLIKVFLLLGFVFVLPRLRFMLSNPEEIKHVLHWSNYLKSFQKNTNMTVIVCQILLILIAIYILLAPYLKKIGAKIRPKNVTCIQWTFGIFVMLIVFTSIALIPAVFFKQVAEVGYIAEQKIQQFLDCQLITFGTHNNTSRPLCSDKVTENYFVKQAIQQFKNQNQTIQYCKKHIVQLQTDYFGSQIFHYDEIACTWYSIIAKASNHSAFQSQTQQLSTASIVSTGTSIFKKVFGNLTSILSSFSNAIFCFTIWLTTFLLTTDLPTRQQTIKHIFSQNKQQLVSDITKLIHATCMIVIWHFVLSLVSLELFDFTPVNLIVSILLSLMAFVPLFRPWFGVLGVGILRMVILRQYVVTLVFIGLYWLVSQKIYEIYYGRLQMHQIIVNFSVLFGIYSFGIAGIFYGPLIVILYTCVEKELISNYRGLIPDAEKKVSAEIPSDRQIDLLRQQQRQHRQQLQQPGQPQSPKQQPQNTPSIRVRYLNRQQNQNQSKSPKQQ